MMRMGRSIAQSFLSFVGVLAVLAFFPASATAQQGCYPPLVFPTPILSTPAGCPSYLTYFNDWPQDTKSGNTALAVGDFNNDGKLDAVVALSGGGYAGVGLAVMLGNGDGTFQGPIYALPCCSPDLRNETWVAVGDFNNDGKLDIVGGTNYGGGGYVYIALGNGDGTFKPPFYISLNAAAGGAVGDFNGDGKLDVVVTNSTSNPAAALVFFGNGDGTLNPSSTLVTLPSGDNPHGVVVGDFNHDGKLDFATANNTTYYGTVSVVFGNGDGSFQAPVDYLTWSQNPYNPGSNAVSIVAADFNNDGYLDLATLDRDSSEISVFINNGSGTFSGPSFYGGWAGNNGDGENPQQIAAADFNHDGKMDLVVTASSYYGAGTAILFGNGDGTFQQPAVSYATDIHLSSVAVGDFNGDGVPDVVASSDPLDTLTVLLNKGDGSFKGARDYEPFIISTTNIRGGFPNNFPQPVSVAFGDFNGDGKPDLAVSDNANIDVAIYLNNGDGTFTENANYRTDPTQYSYGPNNVTVADLNGDGKLDLVVGGSSGTSFSTLLGNGDGTFQPAVVYQQNLGGSTTLAVADVNGDGIPDVVFNGTNTYLGANPNVLYVALGNGDGTFKAPVATSDICSNSGFGPILYVAVADVNGDGKPDTLASCNSNAGTYPQNIFLLLGNGDGTFGSATAVLAGTTPSVIAVGDFNGDGKSDLAVGNNYNGPAPTLSVLLGNGDGTFQSPIAYSVVDSPFWTNWMTTGGPPPNGNPGPTPWPQSIAVADFNKDGHLDLLVADVGGQIGGGNNGGYWNNGVQLFTGNGDGTFQPEQSYLACWHGQSVAAADLTGGGAPSAAVACPSDGVVTVLSNQLGLGQSKTSTTTALQSSLNPSAFGQSVTFTATVTPTSGTGTASGTVTFMDGSSTLGSRTLDSSGQAAYSTSSLAVGPHSITAAYGGDSNYKGSTSPSLSQVVNQSSTTTSVTSSANPSTFGQSVTFTATVNWSGAGTPTGSVTFMDGGTTLGTSPLNGSGQATYTTSSLAVGTHSITASYGGDSNFSGSTSPALSQVVSKISTTTSLQSSLNPSRFGQSVTFTATIAWSGPGTPTGTVSFSDGAVQLCISPVDNTARATCAVSTLAARSHSITASYSGDSNFQSSTSAGLNQIVNQASTTTSVASSLNPSVYLQSVTFTATVAPQFGGVPTGTVNFKDGAMLLCASPVSNSGQASCTTSTLTAGSHSITASYLGDSNFIGSTSSTLTQTVNKSNTVTTLTSSLNPAKARQVVTFTAAVTPGVPTGNVQFFDGKKLLGRQSLVNGVANFGTSSLNKGTHSINAVYGGDSNFNGSTSTVLSQVVQ